MNLKNKSVCRRIAKEQAALKRWDGIQVEFAPEKNSLLNHAGHRNIIKHKRWAEMGRCHHEFVYQGIDTDKNVDLFECRWCEKEKLKKRLTNKVKK